MKLSMGVYKIVLSVILTLVFACSAATPTSTSSVSLPEDNGSQTQTQSGADAASAFLQLANARWVSYSNLRSRDSLQLRETPTPAPSGEVPFVWSIRRRWRLRGV
jgi:hypothetical protein